MNTMSRNNFYLFLRRIRPIVLIAEVILSIVMIILFIVFRNITLLDIACYVTGIFGFVYVIFLMMDYKKVGFEKSTPLLIVNIGAVVLNAFAFVFAVLHTVLGGRTGGFMNILPFFGLLCPIAAAVMLLITYPLFVDGYKRYTKLYDFVESSGNIELIQAVKWAETDEAMLDVEERTKYYLAHYLEDERDDIQNEKTNGTTESDFDGTTLQYIGWSLLGALVTSVSLGICAPIALHWLYKWEVNHSIVNGRRLVYKGKIGALYGVMIGCLLLCIITLGLYLPFVPLQLKVYKTISSNIEGTEKRIPSYFAGFTTFKTQIIYVGLVLLTSLMVEFTLGILTPFANAILLRFEVNHRRYNGYHVVFDGNGAQLFGNYIIWWLLSLVTLGIYGLFVPVRMKKWELKHTKFEALVK